MTENLPSARPGWYPDPELSGQLRYWSGEQWGERWAAVPGATYGSAPAPRAVGARFGALGRAVRLGLWLALVLLVCRIGLSIWGMSMVGHAVATGDLDRLTLYDNGNRIILIGFFLVTLITAVLWMTWQYQLARASAPSASLRSPGMHAGSWVIPFGSWWLPLQNVRALWQSWFQGRDSSVLGWWWAGWILFQLSLRVAEEVAGSARNVSGFKDGMATWIVAAVLGIAAAVLARRIVRDLTNAAVTAAATPAA